MNSISKEEYLKLLEEISNHQYDDEEDDVPNVEDDSWIWAESPAKDRMMRLNHHGVIDVTKFRKEKIRDALYKCTNIQVGSFMIRISTYHGYPDKLGKGTDLTMDIETWEKRYKTPSGNPCNMDFRVDLSDDNRFTGRPWLLLFKGSSARKIPVETVVEIIRWMQAIKRMTAFL